MSPLGRRQAWAGLILVLLQPLGPGLAQIVNPPLQAPGGSPPQVIATFPELGLEGYAGPTPYDGPVSDATARPTVPGAQAAPSGEGGMTTAMTAMMNTSYGATAVTTAQRLGVNVNGTAAIGQAESRFRNVQTELGTSAATGPWQIVPGTFAGISRQYGLGYSPSDITSPEAQAVASNYIIRDTARAISAETQAPATVVQTYMGYVFGPTTGARIASATDNTRLGDVVSSRFLSNNHLPESMTVGQLTEIYSGRLGPAASQPALSPQTS